MTASQSTTSYGHMIGLAFSTRPSRIQGLPRYERKKLQTRERIYRAALNLFAERGLAATTVDQITEVADVAKGTFFNYFRSKEQVFGYFIELQLGKVGEALEEVRKGKPVGAVLRKAFRRLAGEVGTSPNLARALIAAVLGNDIARETVANGMAQSRQLLTRILTIGQAREQVRGDRRVTTMSLAFQQALFGTLVLWAIRPQAKLATLLDASFEDYWACIAAERGKSKRGGTQ
jgi:AcrR family transcriptional regulator